MADAAAAGTADGVIVAAASVWAIGRACRAAHCWYVSAETADDAHGSRRAACKQCSQGYVP